MLYLIAFLGAAMFAFFQLTGGNIHFLRVSDGLGVMGRLAFGAPPSPLCSHSRLPRGGSGSKGARRRPHAHPFLANTP
jgi:hypothetical protein